ncbi:d3f00137-d342-4c81-8e05-dd1ba0934500 [Thermothielavioides terrestris]|uniref:D3f00137-d342-4c81-8e05-dd1ba0934500 n=1 Tax=Thermothielavioides terrestris TaxID=2587410 RepID=A0A446BLQ7_9PEZI|nr:d3f00137-d342-4c81-8e05-dd1ba0934500 [Thermothielavioides terrestris]
MQLSLTTIVLSLAAIAAATPQDAPTIMTRQNQNRPVPSGNCCIANTSLKQDACTAANGQAGRCVPGGNNCGGALSCVAQSNLQCDNSIIERGKSLCRAKAANGGFIDGARIINSLSQATVN